jgi:asparagine synthase (glutamine-hydrolysing)
MHRVSGIVGIVNLDGAPVDQVQLERMTAFLKFRGPDATCMRIAGTAGFGWTLLKTTDESAHERQPVTLDQKVWIVADARVDARADLVAKLRDHGHEVRTHAPDVELILHAYCVWQGNCVEHLLGDFAFAVWDAPRRRLFLAGDQMGIKSVFYSRVGNSIVFSNTLDCIRCHSAISDRLNDLAIADFLLFDLNQDRAITSFAEVQRLPPAHAATWSDAGSRVRRYWTLPIDEPVFFRHNGEYVEKLKELLQAAVADRLRTDRVGVFLSGGLDSSALAATARDLMRDRPGRCEVRAFTASSGGYDEERHYAGLVARSLDIAIDFRGWDPDCVDPEWYETALHTPEPIAYPMSLAAYWADFARVAVHGRTAFHGEGPDNALRYEWRPYLSHLVRRRRFGALLKDLCTHSVLHRRMPLPASILGRLKCKRQSERAESFFPDWFNPDFARRVQLHERWEHIQAEVPPTHPIRPEGHHSFQIPLWQGLFESFDTAYTNALVEVRHPFMDLRVLRYLLAVPAVPWCRDKYLLRTAMRGLLPEPVLRRVKHPVVRDLWAARVLECGLPSVDADSRLEAYVDTKRVADPTNGSESRFWAALRTRSLNYWLRNLNLRRSEEDYPNGRIRQAKLG